MSRQGLIIYIKVVINQYANISVAHQLISAIAVSRHVTG